MGIDFNQLFGEATKAVDNAWGDLNSTGVPALRSSIEKWGSQMLGDLAKTDAATAKTGVNEIAKRPIEPGSFASIFSSTIGSIGTSVGSEKYGIYIIGGVIGLIVLGTMMARK